MGLNLFSSFPNLTLSISDLALVNKAPFEGDTVFSSKDFDLTIDLMSVISGNKVKVNSIDVNNPKIMVYILKDGRANYNIFPESEISTTKSSESAEANELSININSYSIKNGRIAYIDQTSSTIVAMDGINHTGDGDFSQDVFLLNTKTTIDEFTFQRDNVKFLNRVKGDADMTLEVNLIENKYQLKNNQFKINNLTFNLDGGIVLPNDEDILVDLKFDSPKANFKDILSLIPAIYKNDFASLTANGNVTLNGYAKGTYSENKLPAFNVNINVDNASFSYPDLPTPVNNVKVDLTIDNADGNPNSTIVDLKKLHFELEKEPFDAKLKMRNLEKDPYVDAEIKGVINLDNFKNALQFENITELSGIINSDLSFSGNLESTKSNYENVNAKGSVSVKNFKFKSKDFSEELNISSSSLNFTPKKVLLNNFNAKIGESDIEANGELNNVISFVLSDATLIGKMDAASNNFNVNPFLTEEEIKPGATADGTQNQSVNIPDNIILVMNMKVKNLVYDNLDIKNFSGRINVRDSKMNMEDLSMNLMKGTLTGSGYYAKSVEQENPEISFNLNISNFDVNETYNNFVTVKQFAPIAKYIQGSFSSNLSFTTDINNEFDPVWNTFNSKGKLSLPKLEINGFKPFTAVGNALKLDALANPKIQNVNPSFKIENGKFYVEPVSFKIANYDVTFSGSNGIDQSIDYTMEIDVPTGNLQSSANSAISGLLKKDLNVVKSDKIKVKALIGGTIESPTVKTSATDIAKNIVSDAVTEVKEKVVEEAKAQIDSVKIKAEQKLKEETDKIKAEAKKKEEEAKKKLEEEAKKKLKNIFKIK
ncbi:MAG: hypothetical protein H6613_19875 [Ignavibacteriales bacterium]|nr:hypothetical protein [Ignavibacteriales bacterium]